MSTTHDADTDVIHLIPTTVTMPRVKPLPPNLAWELATLRPHLELMSARFLDLTAAIERTADALAVLQRVMDREVELATAHAAQAHVNAMTANQRVAEGII